MTTTQANNLTRTALKAYRVVCSATGAVVWQTNSLLAAYRKIDKLGDGYELAFNYEFNRWNMSRLEGAL